LHTLHESERDVDAYGVVDDMEVEQGREAVEQRYDGGDREAVGVGASVRQVGEGVLEARDAQQRADDGRQPDEQQRSHVASHIGLEPRLDELERRREVAQHLRVGW